MKSSHSEIKELAGQRLMLGFNGTALNEDVKHIIRDIKAGGIILFRPNIQHPAQVRALCHDCQAFAKACGLPPLIIAVDQEGGTVVRLTEGFTQFAGNPAIGSIEDAIHFAATTAKELLDVGINMNLAPVLDIVPDGKDSIMKDRAFMGDAQQVSRLGIQVIKILQEKGIMAVAKHFPGIGRTILDSHFHLPKLDIPLKALEDSDLIPFKDAMNTNVCGMMLSHIFYPQLDQKWQASLSPAIACDLLRKRLGYDGLVMTDDLDMKAIGHDINTCIRQIALSRIDMALICHKGPNVDKAAEHMVYLLKQDSSLLELGRESVNRILRFKKEYIVSG